MRMTSVVCNVPVLSQKRFHISSFCLHDMKVTSLRYLDAKFNHPSLGASPPNRGNRISCVQNSRKTENRNSVNNSGIGILCSKNSKGRLDFPAVAGLLVLLVVISLYYRRVFLHRPIVHLCDVSKKLLWYPLEAVCRGKHPLRVYQRSATQVLESRSVPGQLQRDEPRPLACSRR